MQAKGKLGNLVHLLLSQRCGALGGFPGAQPSRQSSRPCLLASPLRPPLDPQVLYGRAGYLLGGLLLNRHVAPGSVPGDALQTVVGAIIASGEGQAWNVL